MGEGVGRAFSGYDSYRVILLYVASSNSKGSPVSYCGGSSRHGSGLCARLLRQAGCKDVPAHTSRR